MIATGKAWLGLLACAGVSIFYGGLAGSLYGGLLLATQAPGLFFVGLFYGFLEGGFFGFFAGLLAGSIGGHKGWMMSGLCGGWTLFILLGNRLAGDHGSFDLFWAAAANGMAIATGWLLSRAIKRRDGRFPLVRPLVESSWYQALERQRWRPLLAGGLLIGFGYLFVVLPLRVLGSGDKQTPARYFLPWSYTGWIKVQYEVPNASDLPKEKGCYIYRIPPSGTLQTSNSMEVGWPQDEFYYSDGKRQQRLYGEHENYPKGAAPMVWGTTTGQRDVRFFIGTKRQFEQWQATHSHDDF